MAYAMYDLAAAMRCESEGGWPAIHFLTPFFVYATVQNIYVAALTPGLYEIFEALLRVAVTEGWLGERWCPTRFQTPAGALVYDWLLQGLWGVMAGVLFVRVTGLPRIVPIYGHWRLVDPAHAAHGADDGWWWAAASSRWRRRNAATADSSADVPPFPFDDPSPQTYTFPRGFNPMTWNGVPDDLRNMWPLSVCFRSTPPDVAMQVVLDKSVLSCSFAVGSRNERLLAAATYSLASMAIMLEGEARGAGAVAVFLGHSLVLGYLLDTTPWPTDRFTGRGAPVSRGATLAAWLLVEAVVLAAGTLPASHDVAQHAIGVQACVSGVLLFAAVALTVVGR